MSNTPSEFSKDLKMHVTLRAGSESESIQWIDAVAAFKVGKKKSDLSEEPRTESDRLRAFFFSPKAKKANGCDCGAHHTSTPDIHLGECEAGRRQRAAHTR